MKLTDEAIDAIFEPVLIEDEYVELYGERFLFDSKACDKWNRIVGLACLIMMIVNVVKVY